MKELELKYGCNPNQKPARIFMAEGELPVDCLLYTSGRKRGAQLPFFLISVWRKWEWPKRKKK